MHQKKFCLDKMQNFMVYEYVILCEVSAEVTYDSNAICGYC